jgi:hypothetical protein
MPHAKFDDCFADSPSVWRLSDAAFRLHSSGILYCNRLQTDGFVPVEYVSNLVPRFKPATLAELIGGGKWKPVELDGTTVSYEIKSYLEWNESAEQIAAKRKAAADRKAKWKGQNGGGNA